MAPTVADVIAVAETLWPASGAEDWDAVGLVSGDRAAPVQRTRSLVDAVLDVVDEAVESRSDLLLTHHPLLLRGVTSIAEDRYQGAGACSAYPRQLRPLAAHTNADVVETGTSETLAAKLGLAIPDGSREAAKGTILLGPPRQRSTRMRSNASSAEYQDPRTSRP